MADPPLARQLKQASFDTFRRQMEQSRRGAAADEAGVKAEIMAMLEAAVDRKLSGLRPGQGLAVLIRVEVVNENLSFRDEPNAPDERNSAACSRWRIAVYERDRYACVECGATQQIQAHHVQSWAKHPDRRFDVDNGQTLCLTCHQKRHPHLAVVRRSWTRNRNG